MTSSDLAWQGQGSAGGNHFKVGLMLLVPGQNGITPKCVHHVRPRVWWSVREKDVWFHVLMSNVLPVRTEALRLRANEFAVDTSWHPKAHVQPVSHSLRQHLPLVLLILLWSEQFPSIVLTHNP